MRVVIRADASPEIGSGHVMRCLTLAERLRQKGADVSFACVSGPGDMRDQIRKREFVVLEPGRELESRADWLVVDHYQLDRRYELAMRPHVQRIFAIDDIADRPHECDLLLDQNLHQEMSARYRSLIPSHAVGLFGPTYALLRPQFAAARSSVRQVRQLRRILVFFGGGDVTNETTKALRALKQTDLTQVWIDVLIGAANPHIAAITEYAATMPRATVLRPTEDICELMVGADLAICGGGTTTWERCCLGLPAIVIAIARNQLESSRALGDAGYHQFLGMHDQINETGLATAITATVSSYQEFAVRALRGMDLVDGVGTDRVIRAMDLS